MSVSMIVPGLGHTTIEYDVQYRIPADDLPFLPGEFRQSSLSLPLGAKAVFRDRRFRDSLQYRFFGSHWTVQLDRYNPEMGVVCFIGHALTDAWKVTASVAVIAAIMFGLPALMKSK